MTEETLNSKELIHTLNYLCSDKKFKKPNPLPKFNANEALFIRDLIFQKPPDIVYFYLADHIGRRTEIGKFGLFNSKGYRKYLFINNFMKCMGNATKAAKLSGYSPKSAKQQGHRILRQIQCFCRQQDEENRKNTQ
jgi:hypothetical protein